MKMMMKVEIVSKETIKPSSPTPIHHRSYKLSVFDQVAPSTYSSLVLIYQNAHHHHGYHDRTLKNSLSDTLTLFPPLAGRIKDNVSVDCNDNGVVCYETRVHTTLHELLLADQRYAHLKRFIVAGDDVNADTGAQLLVQINLFSCGGIALGLSFSHKICDAASFATFLKSWSAKATDSLQIIAPDLTVSRTFPPREDLSVIRPLTKPPANDLTTARLVFEAPKVAALKAESASQSTPQPTRVEAVTALIVKCALAAASSKRRNNNSDHHILPYMVIHPVNIRGKLRPTLPEYAFGNVFGAYNTYSQQSETSLDILADELRKARTGYCDAVAANGEKMARDYVEMWERAPELMLQGGSAVDIYAFTSWCRFGFYEADLGMGKPIWVGVPGFEHKNHAVLLDTSDGNGVEAYVHLEKQDMCLFRADPLLLHYASVYPAAA